MLLTKVFAKAGQTEAVFQHFPHQWSVVRVEQATWFRLQIINFYFYFHHRFAGPDGSLFPSLRKYFIVSGNTKLTIPKFQSDVKRKFLIALVIIVTVGLVGFYLVNKHFKLVDLSTISVSTDDNLSKGRVKIKRGLYSINRVNDQELFSNNGDRKIYDGMQSGLLKTDYGENDFLITYDDKYYFQFRHFIFNRNNQHSYNFTLFKRQDTIYVKADIKGKDKMQFARPMHLISDAGLLRCNVPVNSSKVIYNMTELEER